MDPEQPGVHNEPDRTHRVAGLYRSSRRPNVTIQGSPVTRDRLWTLLAVLLPVLGATIAPMSAVDLAYQVRAGDLMRASGTVLRTDPFTFTAAGQPWLNQQWGTGVLLSLGYSAGGWAGLALLRAVLVGLAVGILFSTARNWLPARPSAALALIAFVVGIGSLALRAQLFGIVCFVLVIALLADRRRHPRLAFLVPLVVLAWANLHGSFFLGVGAATLAFLADVREPRSTRLRCAAILALTAVASVVTPFGAGSWTYAVGLSTNSNVARLVTEWQRTSPLSFDGALFYLTVVAAAIILAAARRRQGRWPPLPSLLWLGGLVVVGAWAERGVVWWAFGVPVVLAPMLTGLVVRDGPANARAEPAALRRLNLGIGVVLALFIVVLQPIWRPSPSLAGPDGLLTDAPVGLAMMLRSAGSPTDRVVVPQSWASWFEWAAPGIPVMVDSRIEVEPASAWADYQVVAGGGPASLDTLARAGATLLVVDRRDRGALFATLEAPTSGWTVIAEDEDGAVLRRTPMAQRTAVGPTHQRP